MGGEESNTGHQLLSDYIIPDIKTTHTARVPAGGRERRAGAELGQPRPQANSYFSPGARRRPRKCTPVPAQPRGGTPRECPASRGARGSAPRRRRGGTAAGAARAGAPGPAGVSAASRGSAHPSPGRLPAWRGARLRSTFTWSSPRPPPARPRRLRRLRGGARELVGPREAPRGRRRYPRPGSPVPPWRGRRLCVRPGSPRSAPARGGLAALLAGGRVSEARRTATPPPSPRSPLPAGCAPDRWRNCTDTPPPPRLLAATLADARVAPDPEGCGRGAGPALRLSGGSALSKGPLGAEGRSHWCARGRRDGPGWGRRVG